MTPSRAPFHESFVQTTSRILDMQHACFYTNFLHRYIELIQNVNFFITGHAKMMVLALITSMISFASANPLTLAKLARSRWTLAVLTTAPMEQLVPRPPTSGTTFALVLLDLLADFAMKTSTNVLSQLPAATAENVSILQEVTHANARKASKVETA